MLGFSKRFISKFFFQWKNLFLRFSLVKSGFETCFVRNFMKISDFWQKFFKNENEFTVELLFRRSNIEIWKFSIKNVRCFAIRIVLFVFSIFRKKKGKNFLAPTLILTIKKKFSVFFMIIYEKLWKLAKIDQTWRKSM